MGRDRIIQCRFEGVVSSSNRRRMGILPARLFYVLLILLLVVSLKWKWRRTSTDNMSHFDLRLPVPLSLPTAPLNQSTGWSVCSLGLLARSIHPGLGSQWALNFEGEELSGSYVIHKPELRGWCTNAEPTSMSLLWRVLSVVYRAENERQRGSGRRRRRSGVAWNCRVVWVAISMTWTFALWVASCPLELCNFSKINQNR